MVRIGVSVRALKSLLLQRVLHFIVFKQKKLLRYFSSTYLFMYSLFCHKVLCGGIVSSISLAYVMRNSTLSYLYNWKIISKVVVLALTIFLIFKFQKNALFKYLNLFFEVLCWNYI